MEDREDDEIRQTPFTVWRSKIVKIVLSLYTVVLFFALPMPAGLRGIIIVGVIFGGIVYFFRADPTVALPSPAIGSASTYDYEHNRLVLDNELSNGHHDHLPDASVELDIAFSKLMRANNISPELF